MTIIVGVKANNGEPGVAIAADRAQIKADNILEYQLRVLARLDDYAIGHHLDLLREHEIDRAVVTAARKIYASEDGKRVLTHTGTSNPIHDRIKMLLLRPEEFLADTEFLKEMLAVQLPIRKDMKRAVDQYRRHFDLQARLKRGFIPEITAINLAESRKPAEREIVGIKFQVRTEEVSPERSAYLFALCFECKEGTYPLLFDLFSDGRIFLRDYFAKGCGNKLALAYLRRELDTVEFLPGAEGQTKKEIDLQETERIAVGAVKYANEHHPLCQGVDSVTLRESGVEPHFSDEEFRRDIFIDDLVDARLRRLEKDGRVLADLRYALRTIVPT